MTTQLTASVHPGDTGDPTAAGDTTAAGGHRAGSRTTLWSRFLTRRLSGAAVNIGLLVLLTFFIVQLIPG
ncbi:MAG: hypothetical protein HGA44_11530, partial [Cellulomonadaceae bacterium]|nr:hypothetical protein [Cellulomonadaceae bacterium]